MTTSILTARVTSRDAAGSYAPANGLNLYYETHGTSSKGSDGKPLILLHGGLGTIDMFVELLPALAGSRQVIGVELQGHGHTADIVRPLNFEHMADDIAALIKHLGLDNADLLGYSLGGSVALQTAIRHPEVVHKLVLVSASFKRDGWYPENLAGMALMNAEVARTWVGSPMHEAYASVAPEPENWPALVGKLGDMLREDYDWTTSVAALKTPTLIVVGDADGIRPGHIAEMYELLGGGKAIGIMDSPPSSQLAVLPGTTHFSILFRTDLLLPIIPPFLDAPMPGTA